MKPVFLMDMRALLKPFAYLKKYLIRIFYKEKHLTFKWKNDGMNRAKNSKFFYREGGFQNFLTKGWANFGPRVRSGQPRPWLFVQAGSAHKKAASRTLMKLTPGFNSINVLCAAFMRSDPKSPKKTVKLSVFLVPLESVGVKAERITLMKSTLGL